jgi:hypothetical protein
MLPRAVGSRRKRPAWVSDFLSVLPRGALCCAAYWPRICQTGASPRPCWSNWWKVECAPWLAPAVGRDLNGRRSARRQRSDAPTSSASSVSTTSLIPGPDLHLGGRRSVCGWMGCGTVAGSYGENVARRIIGFRPLALALLASSLAFVNLGCPFHREPSVARLVNDLDDPVRLRLCSSDDCREGFHPPDKTLPPGEDWDVNVSSSGVPAVYLVESPGGVRYGCLPLVAPERRPRLTVLVSEHVPCRGGLDEGHFWPSRWANVKDE